MSVRPSGQAQVILGERALICEEGEVNEGVNEGG
jgi:hypothetical protein